MTGLSVRSSFFRHIRHVHFLVPCQCSIWGLMYVALLNGRTVPRLGQHCSGLLSHLYILSDPAVSVFHAYLYYEIGEIKISVVRTYGTNWVVASVVGSCSRYLDLSRCGAHRNNRLEHLLSVATTRSSRCVAHICSCSMHIVMLCCRTPWRLYP